MTESPNLPWPAPRFVPALDPDFRPAVLANRWWHKEISNVEGAVPVELALEQADHTVFRRSTSVFPEGHPFERFNLIHVERLVKFLLWSCGGCRLHIVGPSALVEGLKHHFQHTETGVFDADLMGNRVFEHPFEVLRVGFAADLPASHGRTTPLGRHLEGCRIGFDLGASDRKVAAVKDGEVVFSEETEWHPVVESDPQWHFDRIMESLRSAAAHLPRVDAIGGSSAGVIVNNRVMVASLFRGVSQERFDERVKDLFLEMRRAWKDIPFEVANDGDVTALAGSMARDKNGVLGIAMGSSLAAGYVNPQGHITTRLNELAFAPVDYREDGPVDEWSGDRGCGVQYFSQQGVNRLLAPAGIELPADMSLPDRLKEVQRLMAADDPRARRIYETIGVCLGYTLAHYDEFYDFENVLTLGRVTTGGGGDLILKEARRVLEGEFPELSARLSFHVPDEKEKRHGQAIAAASLPRIN